jgi:hypothetical protein
MCVTSTNNMIKLILTFLFYADFIKYANRGCFHLHMVYTAYKNYFIKKIKDADNNSTDHPFEKECKLEFDSST